MNVFDKVSVVFTKCLQFFFFFKPFHIKEKHNNFQSKRFFNMKRLSMFTVAIRRMDLIVNAPNYDCIMHLQQIQQSVTSVSI